MSQQLLHFSSAPGFPNILTLHLNDLKLSVFPISTLKLATSFFE